MPEAMTKRAADAVAEAADAMTKTANTVPEAADAVAQIANVAGARAYAEMAAGAPAGAMTPANPTASMSRTEAAVMPAGQSTSQMAIAEPTAAKAVDGCTFEAPRTQPTGATAAASMLSGEEPSPAHSSRMTTAECSSELPTAKALAATRTSSARETSTDVATRVAAAMPRATAPAMSAAALGKALLRRDKGVDRKTGDDTHDE